MKGMSFAQLSLPCIFVVLLLTSTLKQFLSSCSWITRANILLYLNKMNSHNSKAIFQDVAGQCEVARFGSHYTPHPLFKITLLRENRPMTMETPLYQLPKKCANKKKNPKHGRAPYVRYSMRHILKHRIKGLQLRQNPENYNP